MKFTSNSYMEEPEVIESKSTYKGSTEYHGLRIKQDHSPRKFARKLLKHNSKTSFTPVLYLGQSGTSKTTGMNCIIHHVHELAEKEKGIKFHIEWMPEGSLINLEHIFQVAPKRPTIFVFDDLSNELDEYPPKMRKKVFKALTTVRHKMKNPVMVFSAIHYSKSLDKALRNVPYLVLSSISDEEFSNIDQLWGYRQTEKIKQFFKKFEMEMEGDYFEMEVDDKTHKFLTDNPFRVHLVKRIKQCHFMLIDKLSCHKCKNPKDALDDLPDISASALYTKFRDSYNTRANNILMWWLFINGYPDALSKDYRSAYNSFDKLAKSFNFSKSELTEVLRQHRGQGKQENRGRKKKFKDFENDVFAHIQANIKNKEL